MVYCVMLNIKHEFDPNSKVHHYMVFDVGTTTDPVMAEIKSDIDDPIFHTFDKRRSKAKDALLDWILENKPGVSPHVFKKL